MKKAELVIVGAGPAGMGAALEAAKTGARPVLLDENRKPGGRIFWQHPDGLHVINPDKLSREHSKGEKILSELSNFAHRITIQPETVVFALFPDKQLAYEQRGCCHLLSYEKLIIATGAYDRPVPLPGWTLPGVLTIGGLQSLVKMQGVLPGQNIVLAGSGPLLWVVAWQVLNAGGQVRALVDTGRVKSWPRLLARMCRQWKIVGDALNYRLAVHRAKVPNYRGYIVLEVHGDNRVEEVLLAPTDPEWRPLDGKQQVIAADCLCLGYGLVPAVEMTRLIGCEHTYQTRWGGWVPKRNQNMQTTVAGVYAVGDCAGVAGSSVAHCEGRLAGISAAHKLGYMSDAQAHSLGKSWHKRLRTLNHLQEELNKMFIPGPGLFQLAQPETVVCRCEEITMGQIKAAIEEGYTDLNEIKRFTRAGMGRCQGRMCGPALQEIVAQVLNISPQELGALTVRPPLKPLTLKSIASLSDFG
jgi:NADPH-dependent 2,4-dienoyl-CoA reductase/sulfur reductase-like enzyme